MIPPSVRITAPADNAVVPPSFAITVDASDNSGTVSKVELSADGSLLSVVTAPPWSFQVQAGRLTEGVHVLSAQATDPSNNSQTAPPVHVTIRSDTGGGGSGGMPPGGGNSGTGEHISGGCAAAGAAGAPSSGAGLLALLLICLGRAARPRR